MKIVSHYGVLAETLPNRRFSVISPYWDESFPSYSRFFRKYGISPVCCIDRSSTDEDIFLFFDRPKADGSGVLSSTLDKEIELRNILHDLAALQGSHSYAAFRVLFWLGSLRYHLCSLAKAYIETATRFSRTLAIPGSNLELQDKGSFLKEAPRLPPKWISDVPVSKVGAVTLSTGYAEAIFYEMIAYLTSTRSLLDSLMPVLNSLPSIGRDGVTLPCSFRYFMEHICRYHAPACLVDFLSKNWTWASKLIAYRDCLLHYEILSPAALPSVTAIHSERRIVALQSWLPDNPESHSIKKYKFDDHTEYLSYAHTTYLQVLDLVTYTSKCTFDEIENS